MKRLLFILILFLLGITFLGSCKKDFLEKKPNTNLIVPTTLEDFRALLDDYLNMNGTGDLGEASADNYYLLTYEGWQNLPIQLRNAYIWKPDIYEGIGGIPDWNIPYKQIFYSNIVLDGIEKVQLSEDNKTEWNMIKGWALFLRGCAFYNLSQLFIAPYDEATASTDLGLPIKLKPGVDEIVPRASVKATYDQIISDLSSAKDLLPASLQTPNRNRPCQPAALALLAKVYLSMRDYNKALENSNDCLQLYGKLLDYNLYSSFGRTNDETLYQGEMGFSNALFASYVSPETIIDSTIYNSYSDNDLRKAIYFRLSPDLPHRKNSYSGTIYPFSGLATDEVYLIKAECLARAGNIADSMDILNGLLIKRWLTGTFIPFTPTSDSDALTIILEERRKELIFRGIRWSDLRRLNKEGANITLTRNLNGQTYTIPPNSPLYVLPIPQDEIRLSGIQQNIR